MLARAVKPNFDGLHDRAKHLLIWAFTGKRKLNSGYKKNSRFDENSGYYSSNRNGPKKFKSSGFDFNSPQINWNTESLQPFTKNFYTPHPNVLNRSPEEIQKFWDNNEIKIKGKNCPAPIFTFEEAGISKKMINLVKKLNYSQPTVIQSQGWPIALSGRNMVGVARTGSGKTLGFILPAVIHVQHQEPLGPRDGPIALVLAPTRELVQQTFTVAHNFAQASNLRAAAVYGGSDKISQQRQLRNGVEICVATPGRLLDFLNLGTTNLKRCTYLVIDEADRMFDMGFEPQIRAIIDQIRPDRQVLMWSATWPKEIKRLAEEHLDDYIHLIVGSLELAANPNINQLVHVCDETEKKKLLEKVIKEIANEDENKTIIFAATKKKADLISRWLNYLGLNSESIHSGKTQRTRDFILKDFRSGRLRILVATDVAARGLDVTDIKYVINFDYPNNLEDYIHRIGRTGRHDASGTSHTFLTQDDADKAPDLINVLKDANQNVIPELMELAGSRNKRRSKNFYKSYNSFGRPVHKRFY